jgi:D-lactate dehydrogenase
LRLLTWGTDASFYRLVPRIVVVVDERGRGRAAPRGLRALGTPVTFRAAGTSLLGQAISDSVLVLLGDGWRRAKSARRADDHAAARRRSAPRRNRRLARTAARSARIRRRSTRR